MNIDQIQSILGAEIECGVFESVVVPALDVCRKVAASSAAKPSTLGDQIERARQEVKSWTPERQANCQLQGQDTYASSAATVSDAATTAGTPDEGAAITAAFESYEYQFRMNGEERNKYDFESGWKAARAASSATEPKP